MAHLPFPAGNRGGHDLRPDLLPRLFPDGRADRAFCAQGDRKSTRLNSSHGYISYAVFCLKKKTNRTYSHTSSAYRTSPTMATQTVGASAMPPASSRRAYLLPAPGPMWPITNYAHTPRSA